MSLPTTEIPHHGKLFIAGSFYNPGRLTVEALREGGRKGPGEDPDLRQS